MKKRLQGFVAGALAVAMLGCVPTIAKEAAESITAVYHNIKLVVDGVLVEPKDANGNTVEPFIYNGTTYLPVRAVATAFEKEVTWDQNNFTVFLGGEVDKPAKELELWNRPYLEASSANVIKTLEDDGIGYIRCASDWGRNDDGEQIESITYSLNTLAKTLSGEFYLKGLDSAEAVLRICGTNGEVLYKSPIMRTSTAPIPFEVDVENELTVTFEFEYHASYSNSSYMWVKNPVIVSSDY